MSNETSTHSLNHAPLPDGVYLDPGFCEGCDRERASASLRAQLDDAIAKWEAKGPTSLTSALLAEAAYRARDFLAAGGDA